MIDRRGIGFLFFAFLLVVAQTIGSKFVDSDSGGARAATQRTGEPFVYLLPPTEAAQEEPELGCQAEGKDGDATCMETQPQAAAAPGVDAPPLPQRKPAMLVTEGSGETPGSTGPRPVLGPVDLLPVHVFKGTSGDGYLVLGSYASRENAELAVKDFRDWNPAIVPTQIDGAELGRVVIGPFRPELMRQVIARLGAEGVDGVWPASRSDLGLTQRARSGLSR